MAYTATDLAAIEAVIATGELTVQFADRQVTYRSVSELMRARVLILEDMALAATAAGATPRPRQFIGVGSKGL